MNIEKLKIKSGITLLATDKTIIDAFVNFESSQDTLIIQTFNEQELEKLCEMLTNDIDDILVWVIYPKTSSKIYSSNINRTSIFNYCEDKIFRPVSQVSLNNDLSAVRIRYRKYVK